MDNGFRVYEERPCGKMIADEGDGANLTEAEMRANAFLLAAAPDLLEALKRMSAILESSFDCGFDTAYDCKEIARAAIAKATGSAS